MNVFTADLSEILIAEKRDEEEIDYLKTKLSEIVKDIFGSRFWISYWNYYPVIASTLYYTVTHLSAVQTIGEEYVSLLPLTSTKHRKVPSFTRRLIFILCYALAPFLTEKALKWIEKNLQNLSDNREVCLDRKQRDFYGKLLNFFIWIRLSGVPTIYRLNLALFYLFGNYYSISKRIVGIRYVSFRSQSNSQVKSVFRIFGAVIIVHTLLNVIIWIRNSLERFENNSEVLGFGSESEILDEEDNLFENNTFCCSLCSQYHKPPACIPCGHLFCWSCIWRHIQFTATDSAIVLCPECRQEFYQSRVVPLLNL